MSHFLATAAKLAIRMPIMPMRPLISMMPIGAYREQPTMLQPTPLQPTAIQATQELIFNVQPLETLEMLNKKRKRAKKKQNRRKSNKIISVRYKG